MTCVGLGQDGVLWQKGIFGALDLHSNVNENIMINYNDKGVPGYDLLMTATKKEK